MLFCLNCAREVELRCSGKGGSNDRGRQGQHSFDFKFATTKLNLRSISRLTITIIYLIGVFNLLATWNLLNMIYSSSIKILRRFLTGARTQSLSSVDVMLNVQLKAPVNAP